MDRFGYSRSLNDQSDMPDLIGPFARGTTTLLVGKNLIKNFSHLATFNHGFGLSVFYSVGS